MSLTDKLNINLEEEPNSKVTFSDDFESEFLSYGPKRTWPTIITMTSGAEKLEVPVFARKAGQLYGFMPLHDLVIGKFTLKHDAIYYLAGKDNKTRAEQYQAMDFAKHNDPRRFYFDLKGQFNGTILHSFVLPEEDRYIKKVRSVDFNLLKYYEQAKSKFVELLASQ